MEHKQIEHEGKDKGCPAADLGEFGHASVAVFVVALIVVIHDNRQEVGASKQHGQVHHLCRNAMKVYAGGVFARQVQVIDPQTKGAIGEQRGGKQNVLHPFTPRNAIGRIQRAMLIDSNVARVFHGR